MNMYAIKPLRNMQIKRLFIADCNPLYRRLVTYRSMNTSTHDHHSPDNDGENCDTPHPLYSGHIPTNLLQKCVLTAASGIVLLKDPSRDDLLSCLGETTGTAALKHLTSQMMKDEEGRSILTEKPELNSDTVDFKYLKSLPDDTFGKAYYNYLQKHGFNPDARHPVQFIDDPDLVYVMLRYRQTHDFTHVILNMPPNMLGEVVVKWFEFVQTGLPMCLLGGLLGPVRLGPRWRMQYLDYLPWAIQTAYRSRLLMSVYFEKHWDVPLSQLRSTLNIDPSSQQKWSVY